jgi:3-oxoacyl-[acyl-carrier protein] reductase
MELENKVAIVTGAASGFGRAIAAAYAREGAQVACLDVDVAGAEAVAAGLGGAARAFACDVADGAAVRAAVEAAHAAFGRLDVVVNNAGVSHRNRPLLEVEEAEFDRVFAVNVKSIYHMTRATLPLMRAQGAGVVVNIGSTGAIRPRPGLTWYNGSKGAVSVLSKSMAVELAPDHVRVNCLAPVIGETALLETFMGVADTPANRAKFTATIPLGRLSTPADVAEAAVWLASERAGFVTGVVLEVDGGRCV